MVKKKTSNVIQDFDQPEKLERPKKSSLTIFLVKKIQVLILLLLTNRLDLSHAPCKVSPLCTSFLLKLNFDFVTNHNVLAFILSKWSSFDHLTNIRRRRGEWDLTLLIGYNINPMKIFQGSPSHIHFDPPQRVVLFRDCERQRKSTRSFFPQVGTRQMIFCHGRTLSLAYPRSEGTISI